MSKRSETYIVGVHRSSHESIEDKEDSDDASRSLKKKKCEKRKQRDVHVYTKEERVKLIERYRVKRKRGGIHVSQCVKYDHRSQIAQARPRYKGRFLSYRILSKVDVDDDNDDADDNNVTSPLFFPPPPLSSYRSSSPSSSSYSPLSSSSLCYTPSSSSLHDDDDDNRTENEVDADPLPTSSFPSSPSSLSSSTPSPRHLFTTLNDGESKLSPLSRFLPRPDATPIASTFSTFSPPLLSPPTPTPTSPLPSPPSPMSTSSSSCSSSSSSSPSALHPPSSSFSWSWSQSPHSFFSRDDWFSVLPPLFRSITPPCE